MRKSDFFDHTDSIPKLIAIYIIIIIGCLITIYPILNTFAISLRPGSSLFSTSLSIVQNNSTLQNYVDAFVKYDLTKWIMNSFIISFTSTIFGVLIAITAGYAFSRYNFVGRKTGMSTLFITQMFPVTMILLPLYLLIVKVGLRESYTGIIIVYVATAIPFNIWMIKGYFDTIPKSLEESAYVDGCNVVQAFYMIMLPLASPAIALCALFSFMGAWSEYIVARAILSKSDMYTLPIGLVNMQGQFSTDWGIYSAAALVTALPVIVIFITLSKYLVGGLSAGGVKE